MSVLDQFKLFADYNKLVNQRILESASKLSEEQLKCDRGAYFKSVLGTLNHMLVGDIIWLKRFHTHPAHEKALDELVDKSEGIEHGRMLYDAVDYHLPSLGALEFSRLPSMLGLMKRFDRAAVLTDKARLKTISEIEGAPYPGLEIIAFTREQKAAAEAWLAG